MEGAIQDLLRELKEALQQVYGKNLCRVYLYGSYARHQEEVESDVDVLIVLKNYADFWEEVRRTGQLISDLSLKYNVTISPAHVREADWLQGDSPFFRRVQKECVLI